MCVCVCVLPSDHKKHYNFKFELYFIKIEKTPGYDGVSSNINRLLKLFKELGRSFHWEKDIVDVDSDR